MIRLFLGSWQIASIDERGLHLAVAQHLDGEFEGVKKINFKINGIRVKFKDHVIDSNLAGVGVYGAPADID